MPPLTSEGYVPEPTTTATTALYSRRAPGQPTSQPAGTAAHTAIYAVEQMPTKSVAVAAMYEALDDFLHQEDLIAGCATSSHALIIIVIVCNGKSMWALVDLGSGANLMWKSLENDIEL